MADNEASTPTETPAPTTETPAPTTTVTVETPAPVEPSPANPAPVTPAPVETPETPTPEPVDPAAEPEKPLQPVEQPKVEQVPVEDTTAATVSAVGTPVNVAPVPTVSWADQAAANLADATTAADARIAANDAAGRLPG